MRVDLNDRFFKRSRKKWVRDNGILAPQKAPHLFGILNVLPQKLLMFLGKASLKYIKDPKNIEELLRVKGPMRSPEVCYHYPDCGDFVEDVVDKMLGL